MRETGDCDRAANWIQSKRNCLPVNIYLTLVITIVGFSYPSRGPERGAV